MRYKPTAFALVYLMIGIGCAQDRCMRNSDCAADARCTLGECVVPVSPDLYAGSAGILHVANGSGGNGSTSPQSGGTGSRTPSSVGGTASLMSGNSAAGALTSAGVAGRG